MDSVPNPIDCLLSCSSLPYAESDVLLGPPHTSRKGELAITGWEKVKPSAVYDLGQATSTVSLEPRRRKRQCNDQILLRDVVSMPNLCTKADFETQKWSYMSGQLDEDFSYVYTGGLSERSCKANPEKEYKKSSHDSQRTSVSMCNLTLDPGSLFSSRCSVYVEPMTQCREISKMQPKLEHLQVENRLWNVDLNVCPDLQKDDFRLSGREKSDVEGTDAASLAHAKSSHLQETRKLRRQRRSQPKMWHPPPLNEEPHHLLPVDFSSNTRPQANRSSTKHPANSYSVVTVNGTKRLHNQFGCGSFHHDHARIPGKQLTHSVQVPLRSGKKSNINLKEKQKTTYHIIFDQEKHNPTSQARVRKEITRATNSIPVFIPSLKQEQAMMPKRFSKLTGLQLLLPSTTDMITDKPLNYYTE